MRPRSAARRFVSMSVVLLLALASEDPAARAAPTTVEALDGARPAFDPRVVQLAPEAPELRIRAALAAGDTALARSIGHIALGPALPLDAVLDTSRAAERGRVLWLLALASDEPAPHYRALFESHHPLNRWAGLRLAELLSRRDPQTARTIAQSLARGWTGAARAERVLARIARAEAGELPATPAVTHDGADAELERCKQLIATQRYEVAQAALEKLAQRTKSDAELSCRVGFELGRALVYLKQREKSATHMLELASRCTDLELRTWARYYAGQAKLRDADPDGAIAALDALLIEAPSSSLADDALHMQAIAHADSGRAPQQVAVLEQLVARYPSGDMRSDASFTLAMLARERGELSVALTHLDALQKSGLDDGVEGQEGRAAYWYARTLGDLGQRAPALAAYAAIVRRHIQTYYAQHALGRLEQLDPVQARALRAELSAHAAPLSFPYRAELDEGAFAAALELLKVGEPDLALDELLSLHGGAKNRDPELSWLVAAVFNEAGEHEHATRVARPLVAALLREDQIVRTAADAAAPIARARMLLRIAYPRAFSDVLEQAALEAKVPATLVRAIAREESSFDPEATSPARAYGALQLIVPTARSIAKPLGLPSDAAALKRPEINLRLGARFMAGLLARYAGFAPVLPAAYNAGPGATDRFLRDDPQLALDAWVEAIPYRETRRYTRRVLQAYGFYRWLDTGEIASLPLEIPTALRKPTATGLSQPVVLSDNR
jgi:soluble lytic murein transglycosylase